MRPTVDIGYSIVTIVKFVIAESRAGKGLLGTTSIRIAKMRRKQNATGIGPGLFAANSGVAD